MESANLAAASKLDPQDPWRAPEQQGSRNRKKKVTTLSGMANIGLWDPEGPCPGRQSAPCARVAMPGPKTRQPGITKTVGNPICTPELLLETPDPEAHASSYDTCRRRAVRGPAAAARHQEGCFGPPKNEGCFGLPQNGGGNRAYLAYTPWDTLLLALVRKV